MRYWPIILVFCSFSTAVFGVSGNWNVNASGNWSTAADWTSNPVVPGTTAGDVIGLTLNITATRTITINTTPRIAGILNIGDTNASNSYTLAAFGGGTFTFNNGGSSQLNQVSTSSTNTISAPLIVSDNLTIFNSSVNTLTVTATISSTTSGSKTITNNGAGTGAVTLSGIISNATGTIAVVQNSATSPLTLSGVNTYSGGTTLTTGTILVGNNSGLGSSSVNLNGGTLAASGATARTISNAIVVGGNIILGQAATNTGVLTLSGGMTLGASPFQISVNNPSDTISGVISDSGGGLITAGTGTLTLTNANIYTGPTTISSGTLALSTAGSILSSSAVDLTSSSAIFSISAITATSQTIGSLNGVSGSSVVLGAKNLTTGGLNTTDSYAGVISGTAGSLTKTGSGTMTLSGINTYTGVTTISSGTLSVSTINNGGVAGNLGAATNAAANLVFNGGTLQYTGATASTDRNFTINNGQIATFDITANNLTISGASTATSGGLTKIDSGTLTLSGLNAYTGVTTLSGGIVSVSTINNGGITGNLGAASNAATNLVFNGGTLQYTGATAGTDRNFTINNGQIATIAVTVSGNTLSMPGAPNSSTGALTVSGPGILALTAVNQYTGTTTISGGTLALNGLGSISGSSPVNLTSSSAIFNISAITPATSQTIGSLNGVAGSSVVLGSNNLTTGGLNTTDSYAGVISGSGGSLTKAGSTTMTLSGANTYTGSTTISGGTLAISGTGSISSSSAVILPNSSTVFDISEITPATSQTIGSLNGVAASSVVLGAKNLTTGGLNTTDSYAGVISGTAGSLTKTGSGTMTLSGINTYTGVTTISAGTLSVSTINNGGVAGNLGAATNAATNLVFNGGTLQYTGATAGTDRNFTINNGQIATVAVTVSGNTLSMPGAPNSSTGALTVSGPGILALTAVNQYTGTTTISGGTLALNGLGSISGSSPVNLTSSSAIFNISAITPATSQTIGSLNGVAGSSVVLGSNNLTTGGLNTTDSYAGVISGSGGSLTKAGSTTMTLSGANTYTGSTTISGGTLAISGTGSISSSSAVILPNSSTVFDISGITPATSQTIGSLNGVAASSIVLGAKNLTTGGLNTTDSYAGVISGTAGSLTKTGSGTMTLSGINTYTGVTTISAGTLSVSTINNGGVAGNLGAATNAAANLVFNGGTLLYTGATASTNRNFTINNGQIATFDITANNLTISGASTATSGGLTKIDSGTLTLSGLNAYTGVTILSGGIVSVSTINNGGIAGNLGAATNAAANLVFNGGTLQYTGATASTDRNFTINNGQIATFDITANNLTMAGSSTATSGGLTKTDSGTLTLSGSNAYTGVTTLSGGTVSVSIINNGGVAGNLGAATNAAANLVFNGGTLQYTGATASTNRQCTINNGQTATIDVTVSGTTLSMPGAPNSSTGALTVSGPGTLVLTGANQYSGNTTISAGTLALSGLGAISSSSPVALLNASTLFDISGITPATSQTIASLNGVAGSFVILGSNNLTIGTNDTTDTFGGIISGLGGSLTKTGADTLILTGMNTYTGATTINQGTLRAGVANAFSSSSAVILANVANAVLDLNGFNNTIGSLSGGGGTGGNVTLNGGTLTAGGDNSSTTFSGVISDSGAFIKTGSGTMILTGMNTYTNGTTISNGTLSIAASYALGFESNLLTIGSGAIYEISGAGFSSSRGTTLMGVGPSLGATFQIDSGTLDYTSSSVISGSGSLIKTGTGIFLIEGVNTFSGDTYIQNGTIQVTTAQAVGPQPSPGSSQYALHIYNGATFEVSNTSWTTERQVELVSGVGSIDVTNNFVLQRNGLVYGAGGLSSNGTGTLILTNANTYSGGTTIGNGIIQVNNTTGSATGTGSVTVQNGATLSGLRTLNSGPGQTGSIAGIVEIQNGGTLLTLSGSGETLTLGGLTLDAGSLTICQLDALPASSLVTISGTNTFSIPTFPSTSAIQIVNNGTMTLGTYNLFQYQGTPLSDISSLQLVLNHLGSFNLALSNNMATPSIDLIVTAILAQWSGAINTNWSNTGNWWAGTVPNGIGDDARFVDNNGEGFGPSVTATLDINVTVGSITFNNSNTAFTITPAVNQTLTMNETGINNALIQVLSTPSITNHLISAPVILSSDLTVAISSSTGGYGLNISGPISESSAGMTLTTTDSGPLTLSGSLPNSYTGLTEISAGILNLQKSAGVNAIGTGGLQINFFATANLLASDQIDNSASLEVNGTFAMGIFSETIATLTGSGTITTGSGSILTISGATSSSFLGQINGAGSVVKGGSSILTLDGTNAYSGGTIINGGTLQISSDSNLGNTSGSVTLNGGTLAFSGGFATNRNMLLNDLGGIFDTENNTVTFTGLISSIGTGIGTLTKNGTGTLDLNNSNTYSGATIINDGILHVDSNGALGNTSSITVFANGEIELNSNGLVISVPISLYGGKVCSFINTNTFSGPITLYADSRVEAHASTLIISGPVSQNGGSYGITKVGPGIVNLSSANNTYTGATVISFGTLQAGVSTSAFGLNSPVTLANTVGALLDLHNFNNTIGSLNGGGDVGGYISLGSATLTTGALNTADYYVGVISGTGGLTKTGSNTLTLANANLFSGTTAINEGTLALSGSGSISYSALNLSGSSTIFDISLTTPAISQTIGSLNGVTSSSVHLGAISLITGELNTTDSYSGVISGTGSLTKIGSGTMTFSGMNTYTGVTTISAGTLSVSVINNGGIAGNLGAATNVPSNLVFDGGTLQYTGATDSTDRSFTITVGHNAIFDITANNLTLYGASLAVTGGLTKIGAGILTLAGENFYTGATTINDGTLALANSGSISASSSVNLPNSAASFDISNLSGSGLPIGSLNGVTGSFVILGSKNLTTGGLNTQDSYDGIISGPGGALIKTGSGTFTISGSNTYSGGTAIDQGTVAIANSTALGSGPVQLNNATLDIGLNTLNVGSSYTQNGSSILLVDINGIANGSIVSAGPATVLATDSLILNVSNYIPQNTTYVIIDGGAGGNIVAPVITVTGPTMAKFFVTLTGDDLVLTANRLSNNFASSAQNANARAVGTVLDNISNPSSDMTYVLQTLDGLSSANVNAALNTMYTEIDGGILNITESMLDNFVAVALSRIEKIRMRRVQAERGVSSGDESLIREFWGKGYGCYLQQEKRNGIIGYDAWNTGAMLGGDGSFHDSIILGLSSGYSYGQVDSHTVNTEKTFINSAQVTFYGGYSEICSPFFVDGAGYFAYNWYSGKRDINIGNIILRTARANYHGLQYGAYIGTGYQVNLNRVGLTPLFSLQWNHLDVGSYSEQGANSLNLSLKKQNYNQLQTGLGARISFSANFVWGELTPEFHARWFYDFIDDAMAVTSIFTGGGAAFPTNGSKPAPNSANVGGMAIFDFKNDLSIFANFDSEFRSQFWGIYSSVTVNYAF